MKRNQTLVLGGIIIVLLAVIGVLIVRKEPPVTPTTTSSDNSSSQSSIRLDSQPSQQQTLEQLRANPAYQTPKTDLTYADLFRNADSYKGQYVRYTGKVIQVLGDPGNWNIRVNVTKKTIGTYDSWSDTVFLFSTSNERVIDNDIIEFTALVNGTVTYDSTLGGKITVPSLSIFEHKLLGNSQ